MKKPPSKTGLGRRNFLKGAGVSAAAGAAAIVTPGIVAPMPAEAQQPANAAAKPAPEPRESDPSPISAEVLDGVRPGSDFMIDCLKSIGFEYMCANPGSSFRSLHESLVNYGNNQKPEFITCTHEEASVAMAHGYFKIEGKPAAVFAHGTVGLQHASMALYNAWCDRVPVYVVLGNTLDVTERRPGAEWSHSVQDAASMVRDFVKWDDSPISLQHFAESSIRAYKIAMTPPMMPVVLVADLGLQEDAIKDEKALRIPKLTIPKPPTGDPDSVADLARMLVNAENPVLIADHLARTPNGMKLFVELAELLQCAIVDPGIRLNFPSRHPLNQTERRAAAIAAADVVVGMELQDFWGAINSYQDVRHRYFRPITKPGTKIVSLTTSDLYIRSNYQDFQRMPEVDLAIAGDAEATLPMLIEACRKLVTADRKRFFEDRGKKLADAHRAALEKARADATVAWDASPVSTARMAAEIWNQIKGEDWSLVSDTEHHSRWPLRLWDFNKPYQFIGGSGGAGIGYGAPAAAGAALANKKYGRLSVAIQDDGDLMYSPGILWTQAHHRIPLLSVMHNNRGYHQEMMHIQKVANRHNRGIDRTYIGVTLIDPPINYAKMAEGLGIYSEGPITNPNDLGPALKRAIAVVKKGEPALIDLVTQPR